MLPISRSTTVAAKASFQVKRRITDPTLINPTTTPRKRAKTITNKLNKATGSNNNPIEVDDDTPTKQGKYWEHSKQEETGPPPPTEQYMRILQPGVMLDDETLIIALKKLKTKRNFYSTDPYFYLSLTANNWKYNRKFFKPEGINTWRHTRTATPI